MEGDIGGGGEEMSVLSVRNLTKRYASFLLDGVSFSVEAGRVCGLIGANGAGKSTTLKGITGLIRCEQGEVKICGFDARSEEAKSLYGYAGGGFRFYPRRTVGTLARVFSSFYPDWSDGRFAALLREYSLSPNKKISELSEGMKVKLSLALALSHGAKLLVLDEPTSGLDPVAREEFCDDIVKSAREEGAAVLFSTHITSDLERAADDLVLLSEGRVLADCPLEELKSRYELALFPDRQSAEGVGVKACREGFECLIPRGGAPEGARTREATLDEIIVHLEYERRQI